MGRKVGALWKRESAKGQKFLSGELTLDEQTHHIVVFPNQHKEPGSKQPDCNILLDDGQHKRKPAPAPPVPRDDDETPF